MSASKRARPRSPSPGRLLGRVPFPPGGLDALRPPVLTGMAIVAGLVVWSGWEGPLRAVVVLAFLLLCPGDAIVQFLTLPALWIEFVLAVAVSLMLAELVAMVSMYARAEDSRYGVTVLAALTVVAAWGQRFGAPSRKAGAHLLGRGFHAR